MRSCLIVFFSLILVIQAYAQYGEVRGIVRDADQKPLPGVILSIHHTSIKVISDQNGSFQIQKLPFGKYIITATANLSGHQTVTQQIDLKRESLFLTFALERLTGRIETVHVHDHAKTKKQEESLNIETLNQQHILRYLGGSLMHTLERLPGVNMIGIGSGQSKPLIRGLGFNRVVVVDKGIKHEGQQWGVDHGLELDQFAASEIEIVKGAASFIYGSDAIAGAIRVNPSVVPESGGIYGSVNLIGKSNNGLYGTSVSMEGRTKEWLYGGRFTYQNYGDYQVPTDEVQVYNYTVQLDKSRVRNTAGRELNYHVNTGYVGENIHSVVYVSNTFTKSGFFANAHGLEPRRVDEELYDASYRDILLPYQQVSHFKIVSQSEYSVKDNNTLSLELGYQHNHREEFSQYVNHGYMPPNYPASMTIPEELEREFDKKIYAANLRNEVELGNHRFSVGINGDYQNNNIGGYGFLVPAFRQGAIGAFIYDRYKISENVLLHGALRYDHTKLRSSSYTDWFPSEVEENGGITERHLLRAEELNKTYNSLVWSLGANYNLGRFSAKTNVGKSFRVPIAKELAANGVNYHYFSYELGDPNLSPEESYQVDLGLGWDDEKWSVQVSPFYNYFPNYIYLNPTSRFDHFYGAGNQVFEYTQSRVRRYGGEFQIKYNFLKNLSTEVLGEYIHALQLSGDKKGFTLPFSPPPSVLANVTWSPQTGKKIDNFYCSVDVRFRGKQTNIVPPEKMTPAYQTINLQTGFQSQIGRQPIQLNMQVTNLFNAKFMDHTSFYRLIELPELGRNIVVSLRLPFGTKT